MSETNTVPAIELRGITKTFGKIVANDNVNLKVNRGEILSILGENGSGKTTLMNMISGIYFPDKGKILIDGKEVVIESPKDAFKYKIGMIHQHFKLVDLFTATENIVLGLKDEKRFDLKAYAEKVRSISEQYGFDIDPNKKIYDMSVSEKQTVEIIKVLYRGADILILDEPTAVLTPQETEKLFAVLRRMRDDGKAIIIITHKLHEVLSLSDRVAVLCKGRDIGTVNTAETNEAKLTEMMVGKKISLNIQRTEMEHVEDRLTVENLTIMNSEGKAVLKDVSFTAKGGEILGVAGIAGSGQRELLEAIAGLQPGMKGSIYYNDPENGKEINLVTKNPKQIRELGVRLSFVPEDRLGMGLVGNMDIVDNVMLRSYQKGIGGFLHRTSPKKLAEEIINDLDVVTPGTSTPVRRLSGGNVQKILVGREIASLPKVLMAAYPVRGLDINSSFAIYNLMNKQKENGTAIIFVGEDLDVLLELCDRILVLCGGEVTAIVNAREATKEQIGLAMTKGSAPTMIQAPADTAKADSNKAEAVRVEADTVSETIMPAVTESVSQAAGSNPESAETDPDTPEEVRNAMESGQKVPLKAAMEAASLPAKKAHAAKKKREPFVHIVKRDALPWYQSWAIRIIAVLLGILVCGAISFLILDRNPVEIFESMYNGVFGSERRTWYMIEEATLLLGIAVALTPAFKMRFWNIGGEGQVLMGGFAAAACMILIGDKIASPLLILIMMVASVLAGAVWAVIPAIFKAFWNTNETLFTLMMNYIATQIVLYYVFIWSNPKGSGHIGVINASTEAGWLPKLGNYDYLMNVMIVMIVTLTMYVYLRYAKHGYELTVVGESERTAKYIGVSVKKVIIRTLMISGALCGLIGLLIVGGTDHSITSTSVGGRGFTAIIVSWLAKFNPLYMIVTAVLIAIFKCGGKQLASELRLNESYSDIVTSIIIFFIIGSEFFINYRLVFRKKNAGKEEKHVQ